MSNGEIHEISLEIGKLVSGLQAMKAEVSAFRAEMQTHIRDTEAQLDGLLAFKNKGAGLLFGVSLVAGGLGTFAHFVWDYWKGN